MTTAAGAFAAIRSRLEASGSGISIPLRFQGDPQSPLPDQPTAFAYVAFDNRGSELRGPSEYGGGAGANRYRNRARIQAFVFSPIGEGLAVVMAYAETIAARLRSFRDNDVSCYSADVIPVGDGSNLTVPGLVSEVSNYQAAIAEVEFDFVQIG
jgi:hypothetical protein